ncbi:hypothetical protein P9027_32320 [Bacillus thuringiensis]|uniref:hypothetical protein n=1 Tax=Bacillus cereus group TaxID=86661 RepID=UPI002DBC8217|nr:hypothetical protein [Bacillus thuringiensis]MEC3226589.1 hypothetical protein [Bacillus thuringiensis]MEC3461688.1 hypothetical protein [Bacillus thuringiensis]MEC3553388.1 hypothetical protein [Bacillus thuringiensis]MED2059567.1 hypothetical protein [Bacillus thuringiensis]
MTYTIQTDNGHIQLQVTGELTGEAYKPFFDSMTDNIEEACKRRVEGDMHVSMRVYKGTKRASVRDKGHGQGNKRKEWLKEKLKGDREHVKD